MLEVFRFARFAVPTLFGFILLVLTLYAVMRVFVKVHSIFAGKADPSAA